MATLAGLNYHNAKLRSVAGEAFFRHGPLRGRRFEIRLFREGRVSEEEDRAGERFSEPPAAEGPPRTSPGSGRTYPP